VLGLFFWWKLPNCLLFRDGLPFHFTAHFIGVQAGAGSAGTVMNKAEPFPTVHDHAMIPIYNTSPNQIWRGVMLCGRMCFRPES
jgi:hypothetical protein